MSETYAFGDDNNDISLFEKVGQGIAMGNATAALKRVAKHIAPSNDRDGVGKGLYRYILNAQEAM